MIMADWFVTNHVTDTALQAAIILAAMVSEKNI